jgi:hypothetical protein
MAWIYLIAAGLFEVGWPVGLKWAQLPDKIIVGIIVAIICMAVSGCLLFLAQSKGALCFPNKTRHSCGLLRGQPLPWTGLGSTGEARGSLLARFSPRPLPGPRTIRSGA